jgi:hypothetical protein
MSLVKVPVRYAGDKNHTTGRKKGGKGRTIQTVLRDNKQCTIYSNSIANTVGRKIPKEWWGGDSLVCQPWSDLGWRAIPLVGNINFVNKFGTEMNASA